MLTVDDEKDQCLLLRKILSEDYNVLIAYSGEEAIEILKKQDIVLAIIDHHMPGINGIETIKRIMEVDKKCKFILISGLRDTDLINNAKELGVPYCFSKPIKLEELKNVIKQILAL